MRSDGLHDDNHPISPLPLVHLETEGVIDASYLSSKRSQGEYHLQNLRLRRAQELNDIRFIRGVKILEREGYIADSRFWKKYKESRLEHTCAILQRALVIFVTTSSARSTILRALNFQPDILAIYECGCDKPQDVAIPMTAIGDQLKRMILVGDSHQLPPLIFTKEAQRIWAVSFLVELIARGHVTTRLNTEYRCHSILYSPTSLLFYEGAVRSFNDTTLQPHPLNPFDAEPSETHIAQ